MQDLFYISLANLRFKSETVAEDLRPTKFIKFYLLGRNRLIRQITFLNPRYVSNKLNGFDPLLGNCDFWGFDPERTPDHTRVHNVLILYSGKRHRHPQTLKAKFLGSVI